MNDKIIDFEGNSVTSQPEGDVANQTNNNNPNVLNQDDTTDLDTGLTGDIDETPQSPESDDPNQSDTKQQHELEPGTIIDIDGVEYTVSENGDIVDNKGTIFKKAEDVKGFLEENKIDSNTNETDDLTIANLQQRLGIEIINEEGVPTEFTNDLDGITSYLQSVISLKSDEIRQGTINKFYTENPLVKQFIDYVQLTGTPRGFGELPDRTGIEINRDNKEQQVAIIRMAANEFGNKSLNDNYIKYLESTGALYEEAKTQLEALKAKDEATRKDIEERASIIREEERKSVETYFKKVNDVIVNGKIGDYKLPENIVKEKNGQKLTYTRNDFYNYVAKAVVDEQGNTMTAYQRDLDSQTDEELLNKELIDAWLMFTGGSYKDLVDMIAKEDAVKRLKITSKTTKTRHSVNVKHKANKKVPATDIIFN